MSGRPLVRNPPETQLRIAQIIWTAMFCAPLVLMGVMHFARVAMDDGGEHPASVRVFVVVGYVIAVTGLLVGRVMESLMVRNAAQQTPPPEPMQFLTTVTVVRSALAEGAAFLSAVLFLITGSPLTYGSFALALAGVLWVRPTAVRGGELAQQLGAP